MIDTLALLIWGITAVCQWLANLPWKGAGIIFLSLVFFGAAFCISLFKAGIPQRKFQELQKRFSSKEQ